MKLPVGKGETLKRRSKKKKKKKERKKPMSRKRTKWGSLLGFQGGICGSGEGGQTPTKRGDAYRVGKKRRKENSLLSRQRKQVAPGAP